MGAMYQPADAIIDPRSASPGLAKGSPYWRHFTSTGTAMLELPAGRDTVIAEKGLEYERTESVVDVTADQTISLEPKRWVEMASKGWWSADFHIHRPLDQAKLLLEAERLNLGIFFTMWNDTNPWQDKEPPADPTIRVDVQKGFYDTDAVLRFFECEGREGDVTVRFPFKVRAAEINLIEETTRAIGDGDTIRFNIKPWEITSIRVRRMD
jgi:hypothetical protein